MIAESLIGWAETGSHCIWKRQPQTPEEHEQALLILESQEVACHRYAGTDPAALRRLPAELCDSQD